MLELKMGFLERRDLEGGRSRCSGLGGKKRSTETGEQESFAEKKIKRAR